MKTLWLNGKWRVRDAPLSCIGVSGLAQVVGKRAGWMTARVPGEIHLDLIAAGRMEEPLVSLNAKKSRWVEKRSWWFTKTFEVPISFRRHERQQIVLDGLDLHAQVFLNGELLGEAKNAFVAHAFDVRHRLKKKNRLVVRLTSGEELVPEALQLKGADRRKRQQFAGISHLRKPQFTYGWDWVDVLPNIGIWRGVHLEGHSGIVLDDVRITTRLGEGDVSLDALIAIDNLHPWQERHGHLTLTVKPPKGKSSSVKVPLRAQVGRSTVRCRLPIPDAQLWWPNGMGDQPLYHATTQVFHEGTECDRREMDIGLRTIALDRSSIRAGGSRFCLRVNGQDVFCKGGNWIPADAIIARVDKKKYDRLVADARDANLNMLRVWGGGVYEAPEFYTACDRAGILVWQDFMFACAEYPDHDPAFREAIRNEAQSVVCRLRHHACMALWCGNNENVWGFHEWWNKGKHADDKTLQLGGSRLYSHVLPEVCHLHDPSRPYWPGSPAGGTEPNSERDGDCHWWWPGPLSSDMNRRISHEVYDECRARFLSESGVLGPCSLESMKQFLKPEELFPRARAWREHTNINERGLFNAAIAKHYADPDKVQLCDWILYGQLFQASMYGRLFEALRFRKQDPTDECQGVLIWMYNDCWGESGWTPIDYYLRRKPSYYWIRNACTPIKAIVRRRGSKLAVRVVNDTLHPCKAVLHHGWMRIDGEDTRMRAQPVLVPANAMIEAGREAIPAKKTQDPQEWIYAAYLVGDRIEMSPSIWALLPHRQLAIAEPGIRTTMKGHRIELTSHVYCHAVHVDDGGQCLLSDNYFDLLPGIPKSIECRAAKLPKKLNFRAVV